MFLSDAEVDHPDTQGLFTLLEWMAL